MEEYDNLKALQLKFLLRLAGRNSKVFLEILVKQVSSRKCLDDNTRFLLKNMNLKLCVSQNETLYRDLFSKITEMPDISRDDLKLVLALSVDAAGENEVIDTINEDSSTLYTEEWDCMFSSSTTFQDFIETVRVKNAQGGITFVQAAIDLSAKFLSQNPPSDEEAVEYLKTLEGISTDLSLHKVSKMYIDSIISIIEKSDHDAKNSAISMLQSIKNSSICSDQKSYLLIGEEIFIQELLDTDTDSKAKHFEELPPTERAPDENPSDELPSNTQDHSPEGRDSKVRAKLKSVLFTHRNNQNSPQKAENDANIITHITTVPHNDAYDSLVSKYKKYNIEERYFKFEFDRPSNSKCDQDGLCGFIVKFSRKGVDFKCELSRDSEIYRSANIHQLHDNISMKNMYLYWMVPGMFRVETEGTAGGRKMFERKEFSVPVRWGWWYWFDGVVDARMVEKMCVEYNDSGDSLRRNDILAKF
jgi:hypothetical protein